MMMDGEIEKKPRRVVDVSRGHRPTPKAEKREIDPFDVQRIVGMLDAAKWVIVRVIGGDEVPAIRRLEDRGFPAFTPFNDVWRRRNATDRHKTRFRYPAAPGYVFVGVPKEPWERWYTLTDTPGVIELIRRAGAYRPLVLPPDMVSEIACLGEQAEDYERLMDTHQEWAAKAGDPLNIVSGAFRGQKGRLVQALEDATEEGVIVAIDLLGREIETRIPVRCLRPAG